MFSHKIEDFRIPLCILEQYKKHNKNDVIAGHVIGTHNGDDFICPPDSEG